MPDRNQLIEALAQLDASAFEDVVNSAFRQRQESEGATSEPDPNSTPREFAVWLARRHLESDAAIERVVYLPTGAPHDEIRLLEVNRFLNSPDPDSVEPLDFTPDTDPIFRVLVADITVNQWDRMIQASESMLPKGWDLKDNEIITRA